jgi:hypothetical protein
MAVLTGTVSTDILTNERLRKERSRKWHAASAKAEVRRDMMDMHFKASIAQSYEFPEVAGHAPYDPAEYCRLLENWRVAQMELLLTPAPDVKSLMWKRQKVAGLNPYDWADVKPARVEKAIADDEAFLKAYPTRQCRQSAEVKTGMFVFAGRPLLGPARCFWVSHELAVISPRRTRRQEIDMSNIGPDTT